METTIATESLFRLRPIKWQKDSFVPKCSIARLLGTALEVRKLGSGWHYSAPGFKGYKPAADRAEAKRLAVAALLEWIEEAFSKIESPS